MYLDISGQDPIGLEHEQLNPLDDGTSHVFLSGCRLDRGLPFLKLRIGDERQRGIGAEAGSRGEFALGWQRSPDLLADASVENKPVLFKHGHGMLNRGDLSTDISRFPARIERVSEIHRAGRQRIPSGKHGRPPKEPGAAHATQAC